MIYADVDIIIGSQFISDKDETGQKKAYQIRRLLNIKRQSEVKIFSV